MNDNSPTTAPAAFEPMRMPAIDFEAYAREGNPHLGDGSVYKNHVIIFTGAAAAKREEALALNTEVLAAGGMQHPEHARSELFHFRSSKYPHVAGVIVPRDQIDTCMRWAQIQEMPNMVALQGELSKAIKAREAEFAEARTDIAEQAKRDEAARARPDTQQVGKDVISRLLGRLDKERADKTPAAAR